MSSGPQRSNGYSAITAEMPNTTGLRYRSRNGQTPHCLMSAISSCHICSNWFLTSTEISDGRPRLILMPGCLQSVKSVVGGITSTVGNRGFHSAPSRWPLKYSLKVLKSASDSGGADWGSKRLNFFNTDCEQKSIHIRSTSSSGYAVYAMSGARSNSMMQRLFPSRGPHASGVETIASQPPECPKFQTR